MIMIIILSTLLLVGIIVYLLDDFGRYSFLKPGLINYYLMLFNDIIIDIEGAVCKRTFKVSNRRYLYHPSNRAKSFFSKGEKVYFFNIKKTWPHYGGDMGLAIENMPEGLLQGTVSYSEDETVTVIIGGEKEIVIYCYSVLLMHEWELSILKKNPFLRKFYCLGLDETDQNFKKALKVAPLY